MKKMMANISLDLDNQWSYMKTHGDDAWESYPSYYKIFVPHILEILEELNIKITFFIVGLDADNKENAKYLKAIADKGHEFGNHSYQHEVWIDNYSREQLIEELDKAEKAIKSATGKSTVGFRGPGFSWSKELFHVLKEKGFNFDGSLLPMFLGPLARYYYFRKSNFTKEEKEIRKRLFGSVWDGFRPSKPFNWKLNDNDKLLEIPVSTIPLVKVPFHMSYLLYLSNISMLLMKIYLWFALCMCRLFSVNFSFLLHPLDIIGGDKIDELSFFPGMDISTEKKLKVFKYVIKKINRNFDLYPMGAFTQKYLSKFGKRIRNKKIPVN